MRSMLICASLALPFQMRQRDCSTSVMIIAFLPSRPVLVRQHAGDLLQVLQPHGEVEPVEYRRCGDAGVGQDAPEPGAAVGEGGQRRVPGPADGVEGAADQRPNVRVDLRDGAENLSSAGFCFDIADPDLEVPLAVLAAVDEG